MELLSKKKATPAIGSQPLKQSLALGVIEEVPKAEATITSPS